MGQTTYSTYTKLTATDNPRFIVEALSRVLMQILLQWQSNRGWARNRVEIVKQRQGL